MDDTSSQRVRSACEPCHERKIKCKQDPSGGSCVSCASSGRTCYFLPRIKAGRPRRNRSPKESKARSSATHENFPLKNKHEGSLNQPWPEISNSSQGDESACDVDWTMSTPAASESAYFSDALEDSLASDETVFSGNSHDLCMDTVLDYDTSQTEDPLSQLFQSGRAKSVSQEISLPTPGLSETTISSGNSSASLSTGVATYLPTVFPSRGWSDLQRGLPNAEGSKLDPPRSMSLGEEPYIPTSVDMLRTCTDMETHLGALNDAHWLSLDLDPAVPFSKLYLIQHSVETAVTMIRSVARQAEQATLKLTSRRSWSEPGLMTDSISPQALLLDSKPEPEVQTCDMDPATLALGIALSLKVLDVCQMLTVNKPTSKRSHHYVLVLTRLHLNVGQVSSALSMMQRHLEVTRDLLSATALRRAAWVQGSVHAALEDAQAMRCC